MAVAGIERSLISIHDMLAAFTKCPELSLEKSEAEMLAHGIAEVNRHYKLPGMKPEHAAIASLVGAAFVVYRGKVVAITARKAGKPVPRKAADPTAPAPAPHVAQNDAPTIEPGAMSWFPDLNGIKPN